MSKSCTTDSAEIVTAARALRRHILPNRVCYSLEGLYRAIDDLVVAVDNNPEGPIND